MYICLIAGLVLLAWGAQRFGNWYRLQAYGETPLHGAVIGGQVDLARELIALGADARGLNEFGQSPLHYIAGSPPLFQEEMIDLLLAAGADPNLTGNPDESPLSRAIQREDNHAIQLLLDAGAEVGIWEAIQMDDPARLATVLEQNPTSIGESLDGGTTPLVLAMDRSSIGVLRLLLEAGADPNSADDYGQTALFFGYHHEGSAERVALLLEHEARADVVASDGRTPLYHAAYYGSKETMESLIDAGADALAVESGQDLAIHKLGAHTNKVLPDTLFELLLDAGTPVNTVGRHGRTPLFKAALHGSPRIVQRMLDAGADVNHLDREGFAPIHWAQAENVSVLLKAGADSNAVSNRGITPLHAAVDPNSADIWPNNGVDLEKIRALLAAGADPTLKTVGERSALQEARYRMQTVTSEELKTLYIQAVELMDAAVKESRENRE